MVKIALAEFACVPSVDRLSQIPMIAGMSHHDRVKTWVSNSVLTKLQPVLLTFLALTCATPVTAAEHFEMAALTPPRQIVHDAALPTVLDAGDVARYRAIVELQADGDWAAADRVIATLDDRVLLGHVLAQRYLHKSYRSRYEELSAWL